MSLVKIVAETMKKYADRPAIGERARAFITDEVTQEVTLTVSPLYETITYNDFWERTGNLAAALHHDVNAPVRARTMVAMLAFTSCDYATLDVACIRLGAIAVPIQTGSTTGQLESILDETQPLVIATSVDYLGTAVDCVLRIPSVKRILVLDCHLQVSKHRNAMSEATAKLSRSACSVSIEPLGSLLQAGCSLPPVPLYENDSADDELSMLIYTSGSTGSPKGAMYTQKLATGMWGGSWATIFSEEAAATFHYMPMSHVAGHSSLKSTFARGGTCYFTANSNLSTLLEDISLVQPTELSLVPRICEMFYQKYQIELIKKGALHGDEVSLSILKDMRIKDMGGKVRWASCSSAPLSKELKAFTELLLGIPLHNVYGSTEAGAIWVDNKLLSPPVEEYKLVDVPELGYFSTDSPHPRGELMLKTQSIIPGYYKRPELKSELFDDYGYYRTGDIVAETSPNCLIYLDRRKNVIKLSQGEFVATAQLETIYSAIPDLQNIFIYGQSEWSHLLAVVVPSERIINRFQDDQALIKKFLSDTFRKEAKKAGLRSYEIPRDIIVEREPFTQTNGLLSDHGKPLWPRLRQKYGRALDVLHEELLASDLQELRNIHERLNNQSVLETVLQAVRSLVAGVSGDVSPTAQFRDLGGDSLSAVSLSVLLSDAYAVSVPVDMIISPAYDLQHLADYIEKAIHSGTSRPTAASVHGAKSDVFHARDLTLGKFLSKDELAQAKSLKIRTTPSPTILLTGSTGYLGRFLYLDILEQLGETGGKLICIVRGKDVASAKKRLQESFGSSRSEIVRKVQALSALHLEVLAGDIGEPRLGQDEKTWERLGTEVDFIIHAGALVNHLLPYSSLFDANVTGTAVLIGLALTHHLKPFVFLSSIGVASLLPDGKTLDEDSDIRHLAPSINAEDTYATGYGLSKWAGEVLLREANANYGLPVTTFRSSMILAHSRYPGQLNVPDMFTRLLLSIVLTRIAPASFYQVKPDITDRPHYDGLPVDFTASAIVRLALKQPTDAYRSFNLVNPHNDGVSLDTFVEWIDSAGYNIQKLDSYSEWVSRFEMALRALPEQLRTQSLLPLIHGFSEPAEIISGSTIPSVRFKQAIETTGSEQPNPIPNISKELIHKYLKDLELLGILV